MGIRFHPDVFFANFATLRDKLPFLGSIVVHLKKGNLGAISLFYLWYNSGAYAERHESLISYGG
jgi:hypothetical protein